MKKAVCTATGEPTKTFEIDHGLDVENPAFAFYDENSNQVKIECNWKVYGDRNKAVIVFEKEVVGIKTILIIDSDEQ